MTNNLLYINQSLMCSDNSKLVYKESQESEEEVLAIPDIIVNTEGQQILQADGSYSLGAVGTEIGHRYVTPTTAFYMSDGQEVGGAINVTAFGDTNYTVPNLRYTIDNLINQVNVENGHVLSYGFQQEPFMLDENTIYSLCQDTWESLYQELVNEIDSKLIEKGV